MEEMMKRGTKLVACRFLPVTGAALISAICLAANADVAINGVFSDHMVIQREARVPVWGTAAAGEDVTVSIAGQTVRTKADPSGNWRVALTDLRAGGPHELVVSGANTLKIDDVYIGDVWLCSGQSNMAFPMSGLKNSPLTGDLKNADFPLIRHGYVPRNPSVKPISTINVKWTACNENTIASFTAVGFYFAQSLQKELDVPIGLLHASWGGTSAESWTSHEALNSVESFKKRTAEQLANLESLPQRIESFPKQIAAWEAANGRVDSENLGEQKKWQAMDVDPDGWTTSTLSTKWKQVGVDDGGVLWVRKVIQIPATAAGKSFKLDFGLIDEQYSTAYFNGRKLGESGREGPQFYARYVQYDIPAEEVKEGANVIAIRLVANTGDRAISARRGNGLGLSGLGINNIDDTCMVRSERRFAPLSAEAAAARPAVPRGDAAHTSTTLFGGMIHPVIPFAIKGCLWYQGEQDAGRAYAYRTLLPLMINDWRARWNQGDFPFLIQQLPNWQEVKKEPEESAWAELREAQLLTSRNVPNCAIAVAIDVGEVNNVHPWNKRDPGQRLAKVALAKVYGKPIAFSGPMYQSMKVEGSSVRLQFEHAEGLRSSDGGSLKRFAIAGEDHKFVFAEARIDGQDIVVSHPDVPHPIAVRYAWANSPEGCNLTNSSGLPASPFRTDEWPGVTTKNP